MIIRIFLILFALLHLSSCSLFEERGPIPAYLIIDEIELEHNSFQGSTNQNINYVEVFFEGFGLGIYELPLELAVIPTKEVSKITIKPVVNKNNLKYKLSAYPMYEKYDIEKTIKESEQVVLKPIFKYLESSRIPLGEYFEDDNIEFTNFLEDSDTVYFELTDQDVYGENLSGKIVVESGKHVKLLNKTLLTDLSHLGGHVFIEMSYKNNIPFKIGILGISGTFKTTYDLVAFKKSDEWVKTYIDITRLIPSYDDESYRFYIDIHANGIDAEMYFDDIKLIYSF